MTNGYATVSRFIGSHNMSKEDRQAEDYYATDPVAAEWLLKIEDLQNDIWEPACGEGHLAKVFLANGKNVRSTDLIDRNFGEGGWTSSKHPKCGGEISLQIRPSNTHRILSNIPYPSSLPGQRYVCF